MGLLSLLMELLSLVHEELVYTPETFMTVELVAEVLAEFDWPARYAIEDVSPDGVAVVFPKCRFCLTEEGFESTVVVNFPADLTGWEHSLTLMDALVAISPDPQRGVMVGTHGLIRDRSQPSPERIRNELRDAFVTILTHFRSCILGDFGWVKRLRNYYLEQMGRASKTSSRRSGTATDDSEDGGT